MRNLKTLTVIILTLLVGKFYAQKWTEGSDLSYLRGQKEFLITFNYDNMLVGNRKESDYVNEKKEDYNKKESGKGDKFVIVWEENKTNIYEPKFEEVFKQECGENLTANRYKRGAKYTILLKVIRMEPGFNMGVVKKNSASDFEILIFESANPNVILSKGKLFNVRGAMSADYDFTASSRLQECFAKCGKILGKKLGKICKS